MLINMIFTSSKKSFSAIQGRKESKWKDLWPPIRGHFPSYLQVSGNFVASGALICAILSICRIENSISIDIYDAAPPRSEEEMLKFMGLMNSSWVLDGHDIVTAFNLSYFQMIVDLGGKRPYSFLQWRSVEPGLYFTEVAFHLYSSECALSQTSC